MRCILSLLFLPWNNKEGCEGDIIGYQYPKHSQGRGGGKRS